jgi:hypothetical protein
MSLSTLIDIAPLDKTQPIYNSIPLTVIQLVLQSVFNPPKFKPLSLLLIAKAGLGKSTYLSPLQQFDFVEYVNDITPKFAVEFLKKVESGKKKFLVLPDLIPTVSHAKNTKETLFSVFRSMTEEGINDLSDYGMEFHSKDGKPVRAGLITGITSDKYNDNKHAWRKDGFLSRLLPFSYSHSGTTESAILLEKRKNTTSLDMAKITVNRNPKEVEVAESDYLFIETLARGLSNEIQGTPYRPFDLVKHLLISSASLRNSDKIEDRDIQLVNQLSQYLNRVHNAI